ncbi:hypothetical protein B0T21DRAFT_415750 [Apiosordaria backusii]|uniref:Uncharacterized protein n=1 Tax=Apiosordaria backusii TaxID=314023 RepID=A0AA40AAC9_9PEZI|nr:hypothetical protein B0T21DRAFT_415750 [Apiosordaria backusii]
MSFARALDRILFPWCFVAAAGAYTTFQPACTTPTDPVNFVSSPDSHGSLEILWTSLLTIFACTWAIHHPNVPEQRDGRDPGWKGDFRWGLKRGFKMCGIVECWNLDS